MMYRHYRYIVIVFRTRYGTTSLSEPNFVRYRYRYCNLCGKWDWPQIQTVVLEMVSYRRQSADYGEGVGHHALELRRWWRSAVKSHIGGTGTGICLSELDLRWTLICCVTIFVWSFSPTVDCTLFECLCSGAQAAFCKTVTWQHWRGPGRKAR
jgi:ferredoxin-like protein FixX